MENPYEVVRKERTEGVDGDVKTVHETGYDAMDRVVYEGSFRYYPNGEKGYCVRCVEADGYWNGGAYDPQVGLGCQMAPEKFEEK